MHTFPLRASVGRSHSPSAPIPVGVLGASGYAGRELCAIVGGHPSLSLVYAAAHDRAGATLMVGRSPVVLRDADDVSLGAAALVFSALPHGASAAWVERARAEGCKVVDLSADLRPGTPGAAPDLAEDAVYGLPELARAEIRRASLVANPGCYATAILLALLPLARRGLIAHDSVVVASAASGATGAGAATRSDLMFAELVEDFRSYAPDNSHRHLGEMRHVLRSVGANVDLVFAPHLLPVARGILATIVVRLRESLPDPLAPWREDYSAEPFVEVDPVAPRLRDTVHRPACRISAVAAQGTRTPVLVVTAALDNLVKGAAGQAVQNANLMLGLDERLGLIS